MLGLRKGAHATIALRERVTFAGATVVAISALAVAGSALGIVWMSTRGHGQGRGQGSSGRTRAPSFSVAPSSADFGDQTVATSSAVQTFTVTDDGDTALSISAVVLDSADSDQFAIEEDECSGISLEPGDRCEVGVRFVPSRTGPLATNLQFSDDASDSPQAVALEGNGLPPNVVLIVADDQTYPSLSKMPFVSAGVEWTRFTKAYVNNSTCCPSRSTILTGQYSHHTGVETSHDGENLDESSTLATWLEPTYHTAFFGKYLNGWPYESIADIPPGWDHWMGFVKQAEYFDYRLNADGTIRSYGRQAFDYSTDVLGEGAVGYLEDVGEPFFVEFAPKGPHSPMEPAPRDAGAFAGAPVEHSPNFDDSNAGKPAWWQALEGFRPGRVARIEEKTRRQWEALQSVDLAVQRIFDTLRDRGILDETYVFYLSDNAVSLGSHRWSGKECAYVECNHVPLLIRSPSGAQRTIDSPVSNGDIAPTIADIAQVEPSIPVDGTSLLALLDGSASSLDRGVLLRCGPPRDVANDPPECWGIRTERWTYIETVGTGEKELYDLDADPYELNNLDGNPDYADVEADLAARMAALRGQRTALQPPSDWAGSGCGVGSTFTNEPTLPGDGVAAIKGAARWLC